MSRVLISTGKKQCGPLHVENSFRQCQHCRKEFSTNSMRTKVQSCIFNMVSAFMTQQLKNIKKNIFRDDIGHQYQYHQPSRNGDTWQGSSLRRWGLPIVTSWRPVIQTHSDEESCSCDQPSTRQKSKDASVHLPNRTFGTILKSDV